MFFQKLQVKVMILVGIMLGMLVLYFSLSTNTANSNLAILRATTETIYPVLQAADSNLFYIERLSESLKTAASTKEMEELAVADGVIEKMAKNFADIIAANGNLAGEVELLRASLAEYYVPARELSRLMASGKIKEWSSEDLSAAHKIQEHYAAFVTQLKTFYARRLDDFTATIGSVASGTRHLRQIGFILMVGAIIVTMIIIVAINRGVVRPIITLSNVSQQVSKGSFPILSGRQANDEIGVLWGNFGSMVRDIEENQTRMTKLAMLGRLLSSQTTMAGILEVAQSTLPETLGISVACRIYFAASSFLGQNLDSGFYAVDQKGQNPSRIPDEFFSDKVSRTILVEDSKSKECLAAVCIEPLEPQLLAKVMSVLQPLATNVANALSSIRLEAALMLIEQKSRELNTIFSSISQGICTIRGDGTIGLEYSAFLEVLVGERDLSGKSLRNLLFAKADIAPDMLAQILSAIDCIVDEDIFNFDFNKSNLPREITIGEAGRKLSLELDWIPLAEEGQPVSSIMVTIRDVTEIVMLRQNASARAEDTGMIEELLASSPGRFSSFKKSTSAILEDCRVAFANEALLSEEDIARVARNIHTVKGNSRSLGLNIFSNCVHDLESAFFGVFKRQAGSVGDHVQLAQPFARVAQLFAKYVSFNDDKLKRLGSNVSLEYLEALKKLLARLYHERLAPADSDMALVQGDMEQRTSFLLGEAIRDTFRGLESICESMSLKVPRLILNGDEGVVLALEVEASVTSILVQLLRNSLDHGLRGELEPKITIGWQLDKRGHLRLQVFDSGRGLNLTKLAKLGADLGITSASSTDEELAELIFRSGLSTKSVVTELSGRGVGMDAVRSMCRNLGGDISLNFSGSVDDEGYRRVVFTLNFGSVVTRFASATQLLPGHGWQRGA
jgi:HAMP domain-containing protein/two-component sensor histidine kinase